MDGSWRVGRVMGIPIEIAPSWLIIAFLLSSGLALEVFPAWQADLAGYPAWICGVATSLVFFACLLGHELAHAWVAKRFGQSVKRITLFIFGGVAEASQEMRSPREELCIALAGPASSLGFALVFFVLAILAHQLAGPPALGAVLDWLALINTSLAVFNLVPGFPLDGGRVLRAILWARTGDLEWSTRVAATGGEWFGWGLIFLGLTRLFAGSIITGVWLMMIGWMIGQCARGVQLDQGIKKALSGLKVKDLMSTPVMVLGAHTRLQDAIESHFLKRPYGSYPVVDGARVVGILDRAQVRAVSPEQWRVLEAIDVMQPIDGAERLTPDQSAADAMTRFDNVGASRLPVMQNNELVGYLSLNDIARQVLWLDRSARVQKN